MRKTIFVVIILFCASAISAQTVRLREAGMGKVSVTRGKMRSVIDLSRDVSGCAYIPASARRSLNAKGCAASPAAFQLADATVKNNQVYVVIHTEAAGGCNVCGRCGASESYTLIWLKLDRNLRLLEKKAVPIESCGENIFLVEGDLSFNEETQDSAFKHDFKNDVTAVEFEKKLFNENPDAPGYEFSRLEYNRKTPEKGFIIKTEKRDKSSMKEQ